MDETKKSLLIKNIKNNILKIINNITNIINDIDQFTKDAFNSSILRFRLYRSTLYNLYSLISEKSSNELACLEILSNYNQKITNIKASSKNNPYNNAVVFLQKIASELNEESALFYLLLKYNFGFSDNTKCEVNMLTINEVAEYLKNKIPEFIIRYTYDNKNELLVSQILWNFVLLMNLLIKLLNMIFFHLFLLILN